MSNKTFKFPGCTTTTSTTRLQIIKYKVTYYTLHLILKGYCYPNNYTTFKVCIFLEPSFIYDIYEYLEL